MAEAIYEAFARSQTDNGRGPEARRAIFRFQDPNGRAWGKQRLSLSLYYESCIRLPLGRGWATSSVPWPLALPTGCSAKRKPQLGAPVAALPPSPRWRSGADTIEELSQTIGLTHSATVRVIDGLVADGLATREHVGGGPAVRPRLTQAGAAHARRVLATRREVLQWLVGDLSDEELTQVAPVVARLLERLTTDFNAGDLICRLCELDACPQDRCPVECRQRQLI